MSEFRVQGLGFKDLGFTGLTFQRLYDWRFAILP